jgi:hypothetical protein
MKKLYATIGLFVATLLSAQVPQAFSYQTIAFNASGAPIANGNVALRISILDNSATGTVLYTETQNKTTNSKGLVNLNIGQGTATTGTFGGINWGTNTKFVKVEMDPAGGSNYTNVGVNQLMSVPYSQVSKTVVTGAGQGITLTSPNGTGYTLSVDNSGNLNLPQSTTGSSSLPLNLYFYGSNNSFNPATAELMRVNQNNEKMGYKYFPANTQIKFIAGQTASSQSYGSDASNYYVVPNGNSYTAVSNGFYQIRVSSTSTIGGTQMFNATFTNITPTLSFNGGTPTSTTPVTYNTSTNTFTTQVYGIATYNAPSFNISLNYNESIGDNLNDGNFDINGSAIYFPNATSTPKNYQISFKINVDGTGTYTITQI